MALTRQGGGVPKPYWRAGLKIAAHWTGAAATVLLTGGPHKPFLTGDGGSLRATLREQSIWLPLSVEIFDGQREARKFPAAAA